MELTPLGAALLVFFVLVCVVAVVAWANWHLQLWPFEKKPPKEQATTETVLCMTVYFKDGLHIRWCVKQTDQVRGYMDAPTFRDFVHWLHGRDGEWFGITDNKKERHVFRRSEIKRYAFDTEHRKETS